MRQFWWFSKHRAWDRKYNYDLPFLFCLLQSVWSSLTFTSSGKVSKTVFRRPSCISSSITSRIICNHNLCHHFTNKKRFLHYSQNQNMLDNEEKRLRKCSKPCKKLDKSLVKSGKHMCGNFKNQISEWSSKVVMLNIMKKISFGFFC